MATFLVPASILAIAIADRTECSLPHEKIETAMRAGTIQASTLERMDSLDMDRAAPILIRIYKEESTLEIWKQDRTGRFVLLNSYPICKFSGKLGPKIAEGDHQAPEGFYEITPASLNPDSREYLAFNTGYPNAFDRSLGRTGSFVMVHGGCKSIGCYAMTDHEITEIYGLVSEALEGGQDRIQLQAFPFRMTAQNLARHAQNPNAPFWTMLKQGSDAFLASGQPPNVAVCEQRYVFNPAVATKGLNPSGPCSAGTDPTAVAGAETSQVASATMVPSNESPVTRQAGTAIARKLGEHIRKIHAADARLHRSRRRQTLTVHPHGKRSTA